MEKQREDIKRYIVTKEKASSCYFRSSVRLPYRKAMIQITERCNLHCAHCFLDSGNYGDVMEIKSISKVVIPVLKRCKVASVTLTGGEPFLHSEIVEITKLLRKENVLVGISSNATQITEDQMRSLSQIGGVHINVSLDGFRPESHGRFRGKEEVFEKAVRNIELLGKYHLLQGILSTPNALAKPSEYAEICNFAAKIGATYVLMNPLGRMGRGVKVIHKLSVPRETLLEIKKVTAPFNRKIQVVYIRFPNDRLPLSRCEAGNLFYIFTSGEVAACPYLVFAARNPDSRHKPEEFIVGNVFNEVDIQRKLEKYKFHQRYSLGSNACKSCPLEIKCGKGCPAEIIASGKRLDGSIDEEMCPVIIRGDLYE